MSRGSCTRSAVPATSSGRRARAAARLPGRLPRPLERLPIRWRLAVVSAGLTLVILLGFALVVGTLTTRRIHAQFNRELSSTADRATQGTSVVYVGGQARCVRLDRADAIIRIVTLDGTVVCQTPGAPNLGPPAIGRTEEDDGYRVETRRVFLRNQVASFPGATQAWLQVARSTSAVEETAKRVRVFLAVGVLGGALAALLAGLAIARRAISPIAELTEVARRIERTRDPSLRVPHPRADDEVAELARTLEGMLAALDASRSETEASLSRQREFVADASHELRTPLTSILANLEMLAEELEGDPADAAGSALGSARRMRRLVADLLLLARADAGRSQRRRPTDVSSVLVEAAAELGPVAADHELIVDASPAVVSGAPDELHRLALNLMENAVRHTPPDTRICARTFSEGGSAVLEVSDNGPGIPEGLAPRIFERFVRGGGERAGSSGLGLAIVQAVTESHGGSVVLEPPEDGRGARFVVRLPALADQAAATEAADVTTPARS